MDKIKIAEKFAYMWKTSRNDAGKSQDYMAKALGVSKKTVQNWEVGTSSPSQLMGFQWFQVLGLQPLPYYLNLLCPIDLGVTEYDADAEQIKDTLHTIIDGLPANYQKELLYMLYGSHGSSPFALLELITAYLQTPLEFRLNVASGIAVNYEVAEARGCLKNPAQIKPNMNLVHDGIAKGRQAVVEGKQDYTSIL